MEENDIIQISNALYRYYKDQLVNKCIYDTGSCGDVIRSHTIQNGTILDILSHNGHVAMIRPKNGKIDLDENVSRHSASIFTGLCNSHDTQIFKPIDLLPGEAFDIGDVQKLTLLAYRGALKEYFEKQGNVKTFEKFLKILKKRDLVNLEQMIPYTKKFKGHFPFESINEMVFFEMLVGTYRSLIDIEPFFNELRAAVDLSNSSNIQHDIIELDREIEWAASSLCTPNIFFDNTETVNTLRPNEDDHIAINMVFALKLGGTAKQVAEYSKIGSWELMCVNVFPNCGKTYIVFSYLKGNNSFSKFKKFLDSLGDEEKVEKYLSRLLIMNVGNIVFSKQYVERIGQEGKVKIVKDCVDSIPTDLDYHDLDLNLFR